MKSPPAFKSMSQDEHNKAPKSDKVKLSCLLQKAPWQRR